MFLGYVSSRMDRRRDRDAMFDAWLRSHLWLNGPWLCVPGCALIMVVASVLDRTGGASMLVGIVGLFVWLIWLPVCVIWWQRRWNRRLGDLGVPRKRRHPLVWIAVMLTLVGAAVLGFVGGVVAFTGVLRLFGGGSPFVDG